MMKLALGAGHGMNTPGKRLPKKLDLKQTREWFLNARIVGYIIDCLKPYPVEIIRLDDPTGKRDVPLRERTNKANKHNADLLISIHHNAGAKLSHAGGIQVYAHDGPLFKRTLDFQEAYYNKLIEHTGLKGNRATKLPRANFHMLRESKMSALLPELGFMDSKTDAPIILTDKFAKQAAKATAEFVAEEYGLKKEIPDEKPGKDDNNMLDVAVIINSFVDYPVAEPVARKHNCPIYPQGSTVKAKKLIVVGGRAPDGFKGEIIDLGGKDRFETAANVKKYLE